AATRTLARLGRSLDSAAAQRAEIDQARAGRDERLRAVQSQARDLDAELARLTDSVHRDEVSRAEQRLRLEALEQRALEEVGLDVDALVAGYGPDVPVPAADDGDEPRPYDRDVELRRFRAAERALALLGRVNPLALEEFGALEERHRFLAEQLEDVRRTRKDLLGLISEVEDHVQRVFAEAYADVEVQFEAVFSRLFPGGTGRLVLTDPSDLLVSGVDVEARPPGKKVKRLSLLSGGERALVAVTFLVALFKARPSPFYILDEVEAALDDTNLGRLLEIYEELRANSQLIVITHQKRTMEIGDALYGTSMRGDGVTTVISQRLRDPA
nr:AAA family ATPase [Nocardioidaceae bacterium]